MLWYVDVQLCPHGKVNFFLNWIFCNCGHNTEKKMIFFLIIDAVILLGGPQQDTKKFYPSPKVADVNLQTNLSDALLNFKTVTTENNHQQRHKTGSEGPQQPSRILNPNLMYGLDTQVIQRRKKIVWADFQFCLFGFICTLLKEL